MRIYTFFKLLPVVLLVLPELATANPEDESFLDSISLEELLDLEVVTASKSAQRASDAPATIYVISKQQIANRGYRHLEQLLDDIPEIEIQRKATAEFNNFYSFRGISGNDKVVVLMDGYRINSPTGSPQVIATNFNLSDAERVEVILGPASALYGADALSGIINIITKNVSADSSTQLHVSGGNWGTRDLSINSRYKGDDLSLMLTAQFYQTDGPNLAEEYPDEFAWFNNEYSQLGLVQVSAFAPPDVTLTVPIEPYATPTKSHFIHLTGHLDQADFGFVETFESHSASTGLRPELNLYVKDAVIATKVQNIYLNHTYKSRDNKLNLQTSVSHSIYELLPESNFKNSFSSYNPGYKYGKGETSKFEEQVTYVKDQNNQLTLGLTLESITSLPKTSDLPFKFDTNTPAELQGLFYVGTDIVDVNGNDLSVPQVFFEVKYENYASYFQWQSTLTESFSITAGVRYDFNTRYGSTVNPRVAGVYKPFEDWTFKLLYNEGFLAPSPYVSLQHFGAFTPTTDIDDNITGLVGGFWHLPNPDLEPEELTSREINITWDISDNLRLNFDYYDNSLEKQISPVLFFAPEPGLFDGTFQGIPVLVAEIPVNIGTTDTNGGTIKFDHLGSFGDTQIVSYIAYTYSGGELNATNPLTYSAEDTYKAGVEVDAGDWSLFISGIRRSDTLHQRIDNNGKNLFSPGFTKINLYAKYEHQLNSSMSVTYFARVTNLLDKKHYNASIEQLQGFAASPQDPRAIQLGVNLKF